MVSFARRECFQSCSNHCKRVSLILYRLHSIIFKLHFGYVEFVLCCTVHTVLYRFTKGVEDLGGVFLLNASKVNPKMQGSCIVHGENKKLSVDNYCSTRWAHVHGCVASSRNPQNTGSGRTKPQDLHVSRTVSSTPYYREPLRGALPIPYDITSLGVSPQHRTEEIKTTPGSRAGFAAAEVQGGRRPSPDGTTFLVRHRTDLSHPPPV